MITTFILEGIISNYITIDLIIFYFYFKKNKYPFLIGILYDIIYTDTLLLHSFIFIIISFLINKIRDKNYLYFTFIILIYHILKYTILLLINPFNIYSLIMLVRNIIINIMIYILIFNLNKKFLNT